MTSLEPKVVVCAESSTHSLSPSDGSEGSQESMEQSKIEHFEQEIPQKKKKKRKIKFKLAASNLFSQFFLYWVFALIRISLQANDIRNLHLILEKTESAKTTGNKLAVFWKNELQVNRENASILRALLQCFGSNYFLLAVWKILWTGFNWVGMFYCLSALLKLKETESTGGHYYALGLFACALFGSFCFHQMIIQTTKVGIQCRAALMVLIYRKSLKLSFVKGGVGDIVNLISNECNRIAEACVHWHSFWSAALQYVVLFILCYITIGISALAPLGLILLLLLPLQYLLARYSSTMGGKVTDMITKRVHLMSEVLTAIKLIKFYTWENFYRSKINRMRDQEIAGMGTELKLKISNFVIIFTTPVLCTFIALTTYYYTGHDLTPTIIFTLLFFFNAFRNPLMFLPIAERTSYGASQAFKRLEEFLLLPEVDEESIHNAHLEDNICMKITHADFVWDGDLDHPHIYDLSLDLFRGELIAVVGEISSGKSILAAIMGQIKKVKGEVQVNRAKCGYIPQEPWLINASLRDNILFGIEIDNESLYNDAIRISGLTRDLLLLSKGDETFVNELNLSPSQKQRISIARCIVHNPDIVLMEDCLSDFDQNNARRLFKECIRNQLVQNRCVVMLTQQLQFLEECDRILVVKGGRIVDQGGYLELKKRHANFSSWVTDVIYVEDDPTGLLDKVNEIRLDPISTVSERSKQISPLRPVNPNGSLSHLPLRKSVKNRPSPLASSSVITAAGDSPSEKAGIELIMEQNIKSIQNTELNEHTISKIIERNQGSVLTGNMMRPPANFANQDLVSRTIEANQLTVHSVHKLFHTNTIEPGVFLTEGRQPIITSVLQFLKEGPGLVYGSFMIASFFVTTGFRILSDIWLADLASSNVSQTSWKLGVYGGLSSIIAISIFLRSVGYSQIILGKSKSWHKRILEAVLAAPMSFYDAIPLGHILSYFARHLFLVDESLPENALQVLSFGPFILGTIILVSVIVPWFWATLPIYFALAYFALRNCMYVQSKFQQLESNNKSPMFAHLSSTLEGLFSIRLYDVQNRFDVFNQTLIDADHKALYSMLLTKSFMALCLDIVSSIFIYLTAEFIVLFKISASNAGLALVTAIQLLLFVPWFFKTLFELGVSMESVSALIHFGENVRHEDSKKSDVNLPDDWPIDGEIEFKNVTLRYNRYGVDVLKSVSFRFLPRERIAIVGRSGSGKSTILIALLRITDPSEGKILIDGIDTGTIALSRLRSRIAVIPQEPVMLSGTIRSNLDPFEALKDEDIWAALDQVHLKKKIMEMPDKLDTCITENGKAFSISERQLFCIARAILIKTSIVIFDEPTVTVDQETEVLIQSVIKENFKNATVIVLATRFRVIVQMDRVLVMNHGRVVEFDTPLELLDNPKSKFSLMLGQMGDIDPAKLRQLAQTRANQKSRSSDTLSKARSISIGSPVVHNRQESISAESHKSSASLPSSMQELFSTHETSPKKNNQTIE